MKVLKFKGIPQDATVFSGIGFVQPDALGYAEVEMEDDKALGYVGSPNFDGFVEQEEETQEEETTSEPQGDTVSDELDLDGMNLKELKEIALESGLEAKDLKGIKKADLVDLLKSAA